MLLHPAILALLLVSLLMLLMLLPATRFALQVVRHWDSSSGSEFQLLLERRTYLISTLVSWVFIAEILSLLLFVYTAEDLSGQFVGAMCATGVLNLNPWGWPTLLLKMALFFCGSGWLALNHLDNCGYDYPLLRRKYLLLLLFLPLAALEAVAQIRFFSEMKREVITSCCGALFSSSGEGVAAEVSALTPEMALTLLVMTAGILFVSGLWLLVRQRGAAIFAIAALAAWGAALVAIISFIALYIYEHPHHHCPFCLLKAGHHYIGYALYLPLFGATALAIAAAVVAKGAQIPSLAEAVTALLPRYLIPSLLLFLIFYLVVAAAVASSGLMLSWSW
ncbi:MAG: hypothetical protein HQL48_10205 [Gammaproteobacteria bacterium]|nr:hypothetical protein [Gammaproteobacteria bacterium]